MTVVEKLELIIIGAGPAGISMAVEASRSGIDTQKILILEKGEEHSWSIRQFYPEQKLVTANYKGNEAVCQGVMCIDDSSKAETLSYLGREIKNNHIRVHYKEAVWKIEKLGCGGFKVDTDKGSYQAKTCVMAIGMMGKPNRPDYPIAADIRDQVSFDITSKKIENKSVLVIGGGDSASEYCQYLFQEGNRVSLSYRRNQFNRMNDINRNSLLVMERAGDLELLLNTNVASLTKSGDKVRVEFVEPDREAREFDHIVLALGGTTPKNFLQLLGIEFNEDQPIVKDGFETSIPGLFLIGDLSAGRRGGSIITAFNSAHEAMRKICTDYLSCDLKF